MQEKRDDIKLWRDQGMHGGMEILRARCYEHSYPPDAGQAYVVIGTGGRADGERCRLL